jgi:hypothetical protein
VDFACEVAFEAAYDLPFVFAFGAAFVNIVFSVFVKSYADQDDVVQCLV